MKLDARKAALQARRSELLADLTKIENTLDDPMPKDWEEAAQEREDDEMLQALGQAEQAEIRRIDAALQRMAEGEYGFCVKCGEEIAAARLDLIPDTPFCAACAA